MWQAAAEYVSRILLGVRPGDLAIQEPRVPEVVLNLRAAKKLGLTISQSLRTRATKLID
jgi:putative ABC transport system substrate-binding protein